MPRPKLLAFLVAAQVVVLTSSAEALLQAHVLRIDPRATIHGGAVILTTVVEVVQLNSPSAALASCRGASGNDSLDCESVQMEKPGTLWSEVGNPTPGDTNHGFPLQDAHLLVSAFGVDLPARPEGPALRWGDSQKDPTVGTAWLLALDASNGMGSRFGDARQVASSFIDKMRPHDLMDLILFDTREHQYVSDSHWVTFEKRSDLKAALNAATSVQPSAGRDRALFSIIKGVVGDGLGTLGNSPGPDPKTLPMHQALVVLSNGAGRGDPASASPSAQVFAQYMDKGRFPEDNTAGPKTPLPVVSVWFPNGAGVTDDLYRTNDTELMRALGNVEIGGFYEAVVAGQGEKRGEGLVAAVRRRFDSMHIVKWRLSCMSPTALQSFTLGFDAQRNIEGDATFKDVPIAVDPSEWPLVVDVAKTQAEAEAHPLRPGGTFKVYGNFCWAGAKERAQAFFVPGGVPEPGLTEPSNMTGAMQSLIGQNMMGSAIETTAWSATFRLPDEDALAERSGAGTVAHVVLFDAVANRGSGQTPATILTLKAEKKTSWLLIVGSVGAVVVLGLLALALKRGGRRRPSPPSPLRPVVAR